MDQEKPDSDSDAASSSDSESSVGSITAEELRQRLDTDEPALLDIRNRDEVEAWRIEGADRTEIPYMRFLSASVTDSVEELATDIDQPVVVVCPRGEESASVVEMLHQVGVEAVNLTGGMRSWAQLYEGFTLDTDPVLIQYDRPSSGCLSYLLVSDGKAAVIDPLRAFVDRYRADAAEHGGTLVSAIDTHLHADHISGLSLLAEQSESVEPIVSTKTAMRGIERVSTVDAGEPITVGTTSIEPIAAPGHTSGMTALYVADLDLLLTGDGLFIEHVPRPDLEADAADVRDAARTLYRTLTDRFARFDDETRIAPGHYDPSNTERPHIARLGDIRDLSVFDMTEAAFVDSVLNDMPPRPNNYERIIDINRGTEVADEEAFELELGPNNCAAGSTSN